MNFVKGKLYQHKETVAYNSLNIMVYDKKEGENKYYFTAIWTNNPGEKQYIGKSLSWTGYFLNTIIPIDELKDGDKKDLFKEILK